MRFKGYGPGRSASPRVYLTLEGFLHQRTAMAVEPFTHFPRLLANRSRTTWTWTTRIPGLAIKVLALEGKHKSYPAPFYTGSTASGLSFSRHEAGVSEAAHSLGFRLWCNRRTCRTH